MIHTEKTRPRLVSDAVEWQRRIRRWQKDLDAVQRNDGGIAAQEGDGAGVIQEMIGEGDVEAACEAAAERRQLQEQQ